MAIRLRKLKNKGTNVRMFKIKPIIIRLLLKIFWNISPAIAVSFVKKHAFRPAGYRTSTEEKKILDSGSKFQIDIHGKTVRGWKWGAGPGVLFVHGWNGRGIQFSRFFAPLRRAGYAVITFDAPAHGESGGKTSSYFEWTDTVRAILNSQNEFNIKGMIGHSLGGSAVINALSKENISVPTVLIAPVFRLKEILFNTFSLYGIPEFVYRKAIEEYELRFGYTLENNDPVKLLPAVDTDLLIVHDRHDRAIPFQDSKDVADAWSTVMLHETEGLGHRRILADRKIVKCIADYVIDRIESSEMPQLELATHLKAVRQFGKISAVL